MFLVFVALHKWGLFCVSYWGSLRLKSVLKGGLEVGIWWSVVGEIDGDTVRIFISGIGLFVCGIGFLFMGKCVSNVIFGVSMGRYGIRFGFCYDRRFDGSTMRRRMESLVSDEFWEWRDCCCDQFVTFVCRMDVGR
mgnify:CR=1 FL=1